MWAGRQTYKLGDTFDEAVDEYRRVIGGGELIKGTQLLPVNKIIEMSRPVPKYGIYALIKSGEVVYVGQSKNILNRLSNHEIEYDSMTLIPAEKDRLTLVEAEYIQALNPSLNIACNGLK